MKIKKSDKSINFYADVSFKLFAHSAGGQKQQALEMIFEKCALSFSIAINGLILTPKLINAQVG
jgi:hypothetical protein